MERHFSALLEGLDRTRALCEEMLPLIEAEQRAAKTSDFQAFSRASTEKAALVAQMEALEDRRGDLMRKLAAILNIPADRLTLSLLASRAEPPYGQRLIDAGAALAAALDKVRRANRESRLLIQHCLRLLKNSLGFFQHWVGSASVYGARGTICGDDRNGGRLVSNMA